MKKPLIFILSLISALSLLFGAAAAPAKTANLVSVDFVQGKGLVITLKVTGKFSKADLKGSIYVYGEKAYPLNCYFKDNQDDSTLACVATDNLRAFSGKEAVARFADFGFVVTIPEAGYFCTFGQATKVIFRITLADGSHQDILTGVTGQMGKHYIDFEHYAKQIIRNWFGYNNVVDVDLIFLDCTQPWW